MPPRRKSGSTVKAELGFPVDTGFRRYGSEVAMWFAYLLSNKPFGTLYVGSTNDLFRRIWEHKNKVVAGFTERYGVDLLVWYEVHESMESARHREKQIKEWKRAWKIALVEKDNPHWVDLYPSLKL